MRARSAKPSYKPSSINSASNRCLASCWLGRSGFTCRIPRRNLPHAGWQGILRAPLALWCWCSAGWAALGGPRLQDDDAKLLEQS